MSYSGLTIMSDYYQAPYRLAMQVERINKLIYFRKKCIRQCKSIFR